MKGKRIEQVFMSLNTRSQIRLKSDVWFHRWFRFSFFLLFFSLSLKLKISLTKRQINSQDSTVSICSMSAYFT